MDLNVRKIEFIQAFLKLQSEEIVAKFENLLKIEKQNIEMDFSPFSNEEFIQRIEKSMEDSKNGNVTEVDDLLSEIEKWS